MDYLHTSKYSGQTDSMIPISSSKVLTTAKNKIFQDLSFSCAPCNNRFYEAFKHCTVYQYTDISLCLGIQADTGIQHTYILLDHCDDNDNDDDDDDDEVEIISMPTKRGNRFLMYGRVYCINDLTTYVEIEYSNGEMLLRDHTY
uniref:Uncharacterized protein n=1 Tax=Glossina pallidipes TaxID=7398 RepID=A0A1B0A469_GLOPL